MEGTDLSDAHLGGADHSDANLKDAKLSGAYLYHTDLSHWTPTYSQVLLGMSGETADAMDESLP